MTIQKHDGQTGPVVAPMLAGGHAAAVVPVGEDGVAQVVSGVRAYTFSASKRYAVAVTTTTQALPALAAHREIMIHSNVRVFFALGASGITALVGDGCGVIEAGEKFHLRATGAQTHIAFIGDGGTGNITMTPVA